MTSSGPGGAAAPRAKRRASTRRCFAAPATDAKPVQHRTCAYTRTTAFSAKMVDATDWMTESPTSFYDALAPMFDVMTDWDARLAVEGPFLRAMLDESGARTVLDAACGSGGHALALARSGYTVAGVDVSPVMVEMARRKAAESGLDIPFAVADLAGLADLSRARQDDDSAIGVQRLAPYDAVLCLGNSLPHLLTHADLVQALAGMAAVLKPGGLLVLQNLNYDLRWQKQPRWFAAQGGQLDGREVLVWRFADYDQASGAIAFHIALFTKGENGWQVRVHTTPHRPLFQAGLFAALAEAGFEAPRALARMSWPAEPFDPASSPDLVIVTHRA
jgi:2-polyprenyl-3-methyl-5-hydroxy-6-metoxy-1,4-benzoquinol methylase